MKKMTIFGVSHKVIALAGPWLALTCILSFRFAPRFSFPGSGPKSLLGMGIVLICSGLLMLSVSSYQLIHSWKNRSLITTMFFRLFKHPFFTAWILLLVPGLALLFNSWLILTTSVMLYLAVRIFGKEEEQWLESTFGTEYSTYRKSIIFPFL